MITIQEFKKLVNLGNEYRVLCNGDLVDLFYWPKESDDEMTEEERCTFTFENDKYTIVCCLSDYQDVVWTVEKIEQIDWRKL
jgi:hypothetical protein